MNISQIIEWTLDFSSCKYNFHQLNHKFYPHYIQLQNIYSFQVNMFNLMDILDILQVMDQSI